MGGIEGILDDFTELKSALTRAKDAGAIVCVASGQGDLSELWPGKFGREDLCITCGPSTQGLEPWTLSTPPDQSPTQKLMTPTWKSFGEGYVTICAPGFNMPKTYWRVENGEYAPSVGQSEGSSYSTAFVAGIACLWYTRHAQALRNLPNKGEIVAIFRRALQGTCLAFKGDYSKLSRMYSRGIVEPSLLLTEPDLKRYVQDAKNLQVL